MNLYVDWVHCEFVNHSPLLYGRFGILVPSSRKKVFTKLGKFSGGANSLGGIPINSFGVFTSRKLKEEIRNHAPYLFGVLHNNLDFIKTLNALDTLVNQYLNSQINHEVFFRLFEKHYSRYILNGERCVMNYFDMMSTYRDKVSIPAAVWNEIIHDYYEKVKTQNQILDIKDEFYKDKIKEIRGRYIENNIY